jgi:hypothetical protein
MKFELSRQIFEKFSNTKFNENLLDGSRVVPSRLPDGRQTDMTNFIFCWPGISTQFLMTNLTHFSQCIYFTPLHVSTGAWGGVVVKGLRY